MKYYVVRSSVDGESSTVMQGVYKNKAYAIKVAKKRFNSKCYKKVIVEEMSQLYLGDFTKILVLE